MRDIWVIVTVSGALLLVGGGCQLRDDAQLIPYNFAPATREPVALSRLEVDAAARTGLSPGEEIASAVAYNTPGLGQSVVQVVAGRRDPATRAVVDARAYVVDGDGAIEPTEEFWRRERAARFARFGRMTPELFDQQAALAPSELIDVDIMVRADVPEPMLPYDGTDEYVPIDDYEAWFADHTAAQKQRLALAKGRVLTVLGDHAAQVLASYDALPIVRARVSAELLRSQQLNADDVTLISPLPTGPYQLLGDYAGQASMNAYSLAGGVCGSTCDGGTIDVGLWERVTFGSDGPPFPNGWATGLAGHTTRLYYANSVSYFDPPRSCSTDQDCYPGDPALDPLERRCRPKITTSWYCTVNGDCPSGSSCVGDPNVKRCVTNTKTCVEDHLSWVAASLGSYGSYSYNTTIPSGAPDPSPNVPSGTSFGSSGAWRVDYRIGNEPENAGLNYLLGLGSVPYINRSMTETADNPFVIDWPGRAYGTFVTAAGGNTGDTARVQSARLKNGLTVGWFDYETYSDPASHVVDAFSNFVNHPVFDPSLERPHLLGPGNHHSTSSGLHVPDISQTTAYAQMRWAQTPSVEIAGSSFAAPAVLSAAIRAHQYEGWFSALAFPMVNKAVLMASTRDANGDGNIGLSAATWFPQPDDAKDGGGQVDMAGVKVILDNNQYSWTDLSDSSFVSCGTNCRKYVGPSITIPATFNTRVALAWQSCLLEENGTPALNNDLDLVLNCGNPFFACGGSWSSTSVTSELEMVQRPGCPSSKTCTIEVRIKNGATLSACGSTTTERIGIAWGFRTY